MIRAVLDAHVLVSAVLSGAPAQIIRKWTEGSFDVVVCPMLIGELERALAYPKVRSYVSPDDAEQFVASLVQAAMHVEDPSHIEAVTADPDDDYLVALVRSSGAQALVSGDRAVQALRLPDVLILSPRGFLERLG